MYVQFAFIQFHIKMEKNVKFSSQIVDACNSRHRIKNVIFLQNNRQPNNNNNNNQEKEKMHKPKLYETNIKLLWH